MHLRPRETLSPAYTDPILQVNRLLAPAPLWRGYAARCISSAAQRKPMAGAEYWGRDLEGDSVFTSGQYKRGSSRVMFSQ